MVKHCKGVKAVGSARGFSNYRFLLIGLIVIGVLLRVWYASLSVDVSDAYLNLATAKAVRDCHCVPTVDSWGTSWIYRPPAGAIPMALFFPWPIVSVVAFGVGLVWLTYFVALKLGRSVDEALLACAVVSVTPIAVNFSSINSIDIFKGVYLALGLYFLLAGGRFYGLWAGIFCALGVLTKYDAIVFLPAAFFWILWRKEWKQALYFLAAVFILVTPWMIQMGHVFGNPLYPYFEPVFGHSGTAEVGHRVPLYHYALGLPLTLFGVPEGDYRTALGIAGSIGVPPEIVWVGYFVAMIVVAAMLYGVWKLLFGEKQSSSRVGLTNIETWQKRLIGLVFLMYALFFLIRFFMPIGSDVFDLRYGLVLIPLFGVGVGMLPRKWVYAVLVLLLLGSVGLFGRFYLAKQAFGPYREGIEFVKTLPLDSVVLTDVETTVYGHGISYETGRTGFPYIENIANTRVHVPFLLEKYDEIKARGPNYLWTANLTRDCSTTLFSNSVVKICKI